MQAQEYTKESIEQFITLKHKLDVKTIDIGNSFTKIGTFKGGKLKDLSRVETHNIDPNLERQIVCDVTNSRHSTVQKFWKNNIFHKLPVHYDTQKIGHDRLPGANLLYQIKGKKPLIIADAGTFVTLDIITRDGLMGGYIFPGAHTFLNSYATGDLLPKLSLKNFESFEQVWPTTTHEAIYAACSSYFVGIFHEIAKKLSYDANIILTGGEASFLGGVLNKHFNNFYQIDNLIHYGLYHLYANRQDSQ